MVLAQPHVKQEKPSAYEALSHLQHVCNPSRVKQGSLKHTKAHTKIPPGAHSHGLWQITVTQREQRTLLHIRNKYI